MSQFARPVSDVSTGNWTTAPLWSKVNEATPNDASYVSSGTDPASDAFECRLSAVAAPSALSPLTLSVRLLRTANDPANPGWTNIALVQGDRVVAAKVAQPALGFQTETLILTEDEAATITDYSDLRVRVTAGVPVVTTCGQCPVAPQNWKFTVAGISNGLCSDCTGINGEHVLSYVSGCAWRKDLGPKCMSGTNWYISLDYFTTWRLRILGPGEDFDLEWRLDASAFRCLGSNVMPFYDVFPEQVCGYSISSNVTLVPA